MANWQVRDAEIEDIPDLLRLAKDFAADSEYGESGVKLTEKDLVRDGFGERPWFGCLIAEELIYTEGDSACLPKKKAVGFVLYYYTYSTNEGRCLYMRDLYVDAAFRGKGIGAELLKRVSAIAVKNGCIRLDWKVFNWNKPAQGFYEKYGAVCLDKRQKLSYRLSGEHLLELAGNCRKCKPAHWKNESFN